MNPVVATASYFAQALELRRRQRVVLELNELDAALQMPWVRGDESSSLVVAIGAKDAHGAYRALFDALRRGRTLALGLGGGAKGPLVTVPLAAELDPDEAVIKLHVRPEPAGLDPAMVPVDVILQRALARELRASIPSRESAEGLLRRVSALLALDQSRGGTLAPCIVEVEAEQAGLVAAWRRLAAQAAAGETFSEPFLAASGAKAVSAVPVAELPHEDVPIRIRRALSAGAGCLTVQAGAGCGKTTLAAQLVQDAMEGGGRVLVCAPSQRALDVFAARLHPRCRAWAMLLPGPREDSAAHRVRTDVVQMLDRAQRDLASVRQTSTDSRVRDVAVPRNDPVEALDDGALAAHLQEARCHRWIGRFLPRNAEIPDLSGPAAALKGALAELASEAPKARAAVALRAHLPAPAAFTCWALAERMEDCTVDLPVPAGEVGAYRNLLRSIRALERAEVLDPLLASAPGQRWTETSIRALLRELLTVASCRGEWQEAVQRLSGLRPGALSEQAAAVRMLARFRTEGGGWIECLMRGKLRAALALSRTLRLDGQRPRPGAAGATLVELLERLVERDAVDARLRATLGAGLNSAVVGDPVLAGRLEDLLMALECEAREAPLASLAEIRVNRLSELICRRDAIRVARASSRIARLRLIIRSGFGDAAADVARAIEGRDAKQYRAAREALLASPGRTESIIAQALKNGMPAFSVLLARQADDPLWHERAHSLAEAGDWLRRHRTLVAARREMRRRTRELRELADRRTSRRAAGLSPQACSVVATRVSSVRQPLIAWAQAIERFGRGTGRHAATHRRDVEHHFNQAAAGLSLVLATPEAVASLVGSPQPKFDLLVIDEATQMGVESSCLFSLARELVVIGDDAQLSTPQIGVARAPEHLLKHLWLDAHPVGDVLGASSSLFDLADASSGARLVLRQHYRCHPDLIGFSNRVSYRHFPLVPERAPEDRPLGSALELVQVESSDNDKDVNRAEVDAIIERLQAMTNDPQYAGRSVFVISLKGQAQADAIRIAAQASLPATAFEQHNLQIGLAYHFQGSECDVALLSLVVSGQGRIPALLGEDDRRRFNVAMTRARHKVVVFSSVLRNQFRPGCLRATLYGVVDSCTPTAEFAAGMMVQN